MWNESASLAANVIISSIKAVVENDLFECQLFSERNDTLHFKN